MVAAAMFLFCLVLGWLPGYVGRRLAGTRAPDRLTLLVRSDTDAVWVENLTAAPWRNCVVTLEGGLRSTPFGIDARGVRAIKYSEFVSEARPRAEAGDGFARAYRHTEIGCTGADNRWQNASIR